MVHLLVPVVKIDSRKELKEFGPQAKKIKLKKKTKKKSCLQVRSATGIVQQLWKYPKVYFKKKSSMFLEVGKRLIHSPPSREKAAARLVKAACVNLLQDESMFSSDQPPPTNDFHVN